MISTVVVIALVATAALYFSTPPRPLNGVQAAVYFDHGVVSSSRRAVENMFLWMGAEVTTIGSTEIADGFLDTCDILVLPGGCWCDDRCKILDEKMEIVREFVSGGGALFCIDGGAVYTTSFRLDLFHGDYRADANGTGDFLIELNVNTLSTGPDLSDEPESYMVRYADSGYFAADDMSNITTICTYADTDLPCMIAFEYGDGKVFLSSPHPEYEEGSARDDVDAYDFLDDPDSEWDLMLKICLWMLEM